MDEFGMYLFEKIKVKSPTKSRSRLLAEIKKLKKDTRKKSDGVEVSLADSFGQGRIKRLKN